MNIHTIDAMEARYRRNGDRQRANADDVLQLCQWMRTLIEAVENLTDWRKCALRLLLTDRPDDRMTDRERNLAGLLAAKQKARAACPECAKLERRLAVADDILDQLQDERR